MRVAVCVKNAVDETELKFDQGGAPVTASAPTKMSAFDKNAVEEAVRLKAAHGGEVAVFTVGAPDARKAVKEALAMGADRGVLIGDSKSAGDSLRTAEVLAAAVSKSGPYDLILCSEGSSDTYTGLVPPMLAEVLKLPFIGYARKVVLAEGKVVAERSLESTIETVECTTPAVVSVVSEINEPGIRP